MSKNKSFLDILNEGRIKIATYPKRVIAYSENHSVSVKLEGMTVSDALDKAVRLCLEEIEAEVMR